LLQAGQRGAAGAIRDPTTEIHDDPKSTTTQSVHADHALSKVPEVTLIFWLIKIAATALGETGGDAVTISMNLGYLVGSAIFATIFIVAVAAQINARAFRAFPFWAAFVLTRPSACCDRQPGAATG
jgi:uncharacterized membrane-anchored protein